MATSTATAGIGALSGEIKFSQFRRTFLKMQPRDTFSGSETFQAETGSVSASQLLRDTTGTNPVVPDATENAAIATTNDWKPSQFNNALKYYYAGQTGNDSQYDIAAQSWNSNLPLSIRKFMFIDGNLSSTDSTVPAARLTTTSRNVRIDVRGNITGAGGLDGDGGRGGGNSGNSSQNGENGTDGGNGGSALQVNASGNNNLVFVRSSAEIFAGGGGGGGGGGGAQGDSYQSTACTNGPYTGWPYRGGCGGGACSAAYVGPDAWYICYYPGTTTVSGGAAGDGGDGGTGEGHGQSQSNGAAGGSGASASPPAGNGGDGGDGGNGAAAGVAGQAGQDGNDSNTGATGGTGGAAGAAGAALDGADYDFTGTINTSGSNITIKGAIIGGTQV